MELNENQSGHDDLLVKYLTGLADTAERDQALYWINQSKSNQKYFDQLRDIYESSKLTQPANSYNTDFSWERVKSRYYKKRFEKIQKQEKEEKLYLIREILRYAAVILVVGTLGVITYKFLNHVSVESQQVWNEVEAPFGSRTVVNLADGTKVWLNAGSKLKYAVNFGQKNRNVFLTGEAYFDVKRNEKIQFIVKTSHLDIKVYGTEFDVKAYPEENTIQTTLVKGSVTIVGTKESLVKEIKMLPNQSVTFIKDVGLFESTIKKQKIEEQFEKAVHEKENLVILPKINPVLFTSWKDTRWVIEGETLGSLAVKLERRYNVKFQFKSQSLENYKFSGTLKEETLEQVLKVIKISAPIEYTIQDNTVYLYENKSYRKSYDELLINR